MTLITEKFSELLNLIDDNRTIIITDSNIHRASHHINFHNHFRIILNQPRAELSVSEALAMRISRYDLVIAIGSGTVSDLVKYASFRHSIPYIMIPSAPSMNGYLSANASLSIAGKKLSLQAHVPKMIYLDQELINNAPLRLFRSGAGDALSGYTALFDWRLAQKADPTSAMFNNEAAEMMEKSLEPFFMAGNKLLQPMELLKILLMQGQAMTLAGSSAPASGGEHCLIHFCHAAQRRNPRKFLRAKSAAYHGEEVAFASLFAIRKQRQLQRHHMEMMKFIEILKQYRLIPRRYQFFGMSAKEFRFAVANGHKMRKRISCFNFHIASQQTHQPLQ